MKIATYNIVSVEVDDQARVSLPDNATLLNAMYNPKTGTLAIVGYIRTDEPEKSVGIGSGKIGVSDEDEDEDGKNDNDDNNDEGNDGDDSAPNTTKRVESED